MATTKATGRCCEAPLRLCSARLPARPGRADELLLHQRVRLHARGVQGVPERVPEAAQLQDVPGGQPLGRTGQLLRVPRESQAARRQRQHRVGCQKRSTRRDATCRAKPGISNCW